MLWSRWLLWRKRREKTGSIMWLPELFIGFAKSSSMDIDRIQIMIPEKQAKSFNEFYNAARYNDTLDPKTILMIHLATAMAVACYPWIRSYLRVAKEEGITEEEIGAVKSVVMAVSAGRVRAQFKEIRIEMKKKEAKFNGVELDFSRPGKPVDNAYIESFNGRVRQECLNLHWFT